MLTIPLLTWTLNVNKQQTNKLKDVLSLSLNELIKGCGAKVRKKEWKGQIENVRQFALFKTYRLINCLFL